ncbi:Uncharacterised protein [Burkholderia pseudomallei]|nr:Uncharacterised protein [Burkholderia pseudomallei]
MNKKIYKAVVTVDTGSEEPTIVAEVALPESGMLIRFLERRNDMQCMRIGYEFYESYCVWPGPPLNPEALAFDSVLRMVLQHPLATFGVVPTVTDFM